MPQDFSTNTNQKDLIAKREAARKEGKVLPQDDVTVYATDKLSASHKVGEEIVAHSALADKLVKAGKATKEAPKEKAEKGK